jgi:hypothetical protein
MRRRPIVLAAVLVAAFAAYAGYWVYIARGFERGIGPWAVAARAQGYDIAWRSVAVAGFPFAFRLSFADVAIDANRPTPYRATSAAVVATAAPFMLGTWHVAAPQGVSFDAPVLLSGLDAGTLAGTAAVGGDATTIALAMSHLSGRGLATGFAAQTFDVRVALPAQAPADHRDTAVALTTDLRQATLPRTSALRIDTIGALALALSFKGALPPGPLDHALALWRDDGGTLEIDSAHVEAGGTTIDLTGTLALDAAMQPEGALTAKIVGADKAVDAVVAAGGLQARYAGLAKSVLRAIAAPDGTGDGALHVPLTLEDQRLYVGPAAIAALPHITWR